MCQAPLWALEILQGTRFLPSWSRGEQARRAPQKSHFEPLNCCFTHSNDMLIICPASLWPVRNRRVGGGRHFELAHRNYCFLLEFCWSLFMKLLVRFPLWPHSVNWMNSKLSFKTYIKHHLFYEACPDQHLPQAELIFFFL